MLINPFLKGAAVATTTTTTRNCLRRGQRGIVGMQDRLTFAGNWGSPVFVEFALATLVVLVFAGMKAACVASESAMIPRNLIENFIVIS
jgi:hypothetical protein